MEVTCVVCNCTFEKGIRSWKISGTYDRNEFLITEALNLMFFNGETVVESTAANSEDRRICLTCVKEVCKAYKPLKFIKERINSDSYISNKQSNASPPPEVPRRVVLPAKLTPVRAKIRKFTASPRDKDSLCKAIQSLVNKEITELSTHTCLIKVKQENEFYLPTNSTIRSELQNFAPVLFACFQGMVCKDQRNPGYVPAMRTLLGILLRERNERVNGLQKAMGLILFMGRASVATYDKLQSLGLCVSYKTVQRLLDNLCEGYDKRVLRFRDEMSEKLNGVRPDSNKGDEDPDVPEGPSDPNDVDPNPEDPESPRPGPSRLINFDDVDDDNMIRGGMFTTDNINRTVSTLHASKKKSSRMMNMTSNAFVFNRIPQPKENYFEEKKYKKAQDCPMTAFLPTQEEVKLIERDHKTLIRRVLVKYMKRFKKMRNHKSVVWVLPHKYSEESSRKSEIVSLGILDINQSTTHGTKEVLKFLTKYFPKVGNRKLQMVVGGDALSVKMMVNAKYHLTNSGPEDEKLDGVAPGIGQFHLRMHLLMDYTSLFFGDLKKNKTHGTGSLPQVRYNFNHPQKLTDAKHNFLLASRFSKFATVSYIIATACDRLKMSSEDLESEYEGESVDDKLVLLDDLVEYIYTFEWHDVYKVSSQSKFCFCNTDDDTGMTLLACDNDFCKYHLWYHVECLRKQSRFIRPPYTEDFSEVKYYCSKECQYYCRDKRQLYSKAVINSGLMLLGYHDSIRVNDGERMMAYNKLHMIQFSNYNHRVYFKYMVLSQAMKHGWSSTNCRFDLIHNATVNLSGKKNSNLELDLFHEMLNGRLKDIMQLHRGNPTPESMLRKSNCFGVAQDLVKTCDKIFKGFEDIDIFGGQEHNAVYEKWTEDIQELVETILEQKLLKNVGRRVHEGFKDFSYNLYCIKDITQYTDKIKDMCRFIDLGEYFHEELFRR